MFTHPSVLVANLDFHLDTHLRELNKQGMNYRFAREKGLRSKFHPARGSVQQGSKKADIFR
jgi:hypothetical protein